MLNLVIYNSMAEITPAGITRVDRKTATENKLFALPHKVLLGGLANIAHERVAQLVDAAEDDDSLSDEADWRISFFNAIQAVVNPENKYEYLDNPADYHGAIGEIIKYMKLLGVKSHELSSQAIKSKAVARADEISLRVTGRQDVVADIDDMRRETDQMLFRPVPTPDSPARMRWRLNILRVMDEPEQIEQEALMQARFAFLDKLLATGKKSLPGYTEAHGREIEENARQIQAELLAS